MLLRDASVGLPLGSTSDCAWTMGYHVPCDLNCSLQTGWCDAVNCGVPRSSLIKGTGTYHEHR